MHWGRGYQDFLLVDISTNHLTIESVPADGIANEALAVTLQMISFHCCCK